MSRTILLAAASIIALCAGGAAGALGSGVQGGKFPFKILKNPKILWNQNSNDSGTYSSSQNFSGTFASYDDQTADDFVIPTGSKWTVTEVDVSGVYYNGSGPASSENVIFYRDKNGMPGTAVKNGTFTGLNGTGNGNFAITLPAPGLKLKAGHYWVSVIANEDYDPYGQWGWKVNSVQHGYQAMWQDPGGGFGSCPSWGTVENCEGVGPDVMFDLRGTSKRK